MLAMLGDRDITTEHILQVVEEANNVLDNKLTKGIDEVQLRGFKVYAGPVLPALLRRQTLEFAP